MAPTRNDNKQNKNIFFLKDSFAYLKDRATAEMEKRERSDINMRSEDIYGEVL